MFARITAEVYSSARGLGGRMRILPTMESNLLNRTHVWTGMWMGERTTRSEAAPGPRKWVWPSRAMADSQRGLLFLSEHSPCLCCLTMTLMSSVILSSSSWSFRNQNLVSREQSLFKPLINIPKATSTFVPLAQLCLQLSEQLTVVPAGNMRLEANQLHRGRSPLSSEVETSWSEAPESVVGLFELLTVELGPLKPAGPRNGFTLRKTPLKTSESWRTRSVTSLLLGSHSCVSKTRLFFNVTKGFHVFFSLHW